MIEIEFSVMENLAGDAQRLRPVLDAFEKQRGIRVNLLGIPWSKGWGEIAKFGIYGHGPDVSSIGTTWVGSLAAMQALRPFSAQQVQAVGGAESFFAGNWQSCLLSGDPTVWSIPWLGDAMVWYYWKDLFEQAGIRDAAAAFASDTILIETLQKLQAAGNPYPLSLTTGPDPVILHETAHWIWNAGGDFIAPDNRHVAFDTPQALEGLRNYFSLRPFISTNSLATSTAEELFVSRKSAVQAAGPWLGMIGRSQHPEWAETLGVAAMPGKAYAGGSNFVIWQYSLHAQESFELVRFLGSQPAQFPASPHDHQVPVRRAALELPATQQDDFHRIYLETLQRGRPFPTMRLWGAVEDRLINAIAQIWAERYAHPNVALDDCLHEHIDPLAKRLNIVLGN